MHREKKEEKKKRKMTTEKTVPLFLSPSAEQGSTLLENDQQQYIAIIKFQTINRRKEFDVLLVL